MQNVNKTAYSNMRSNVMASKLLARIIALREFVIGG